MRKLINIILLLPLLAMAQNNLLDTSTWTVGTGSVSGFYIYGPVSENERVNGTDPQGNTSVLWMSKPNGDGGPDGGIYTSNHTIDPNQTYRFTIWLKKTGSNYGSTYFGLYTKDSSNQETTMKFDGTIDTNPYFWYGDLPDLNKWYLLVGYIHPNSYSGPSLGEVYDITTGSVVSSINMTDYKFAPGATTLMLRALLFGDTNASDRQYCWDPTIYLVNGQEPTIAELLNPGGSNVDVTSVSLSPTSLSLSTGQTATISATVLPNDATDPSLSWSSSNISVATVNSSGVVTAVSEGSATITAISNSNGSVSANATINISDSTPPNGTVWVQDGSNIHYNNGSVGIGTTTSGAYKLAVDGHVRAREIRVDQDTWPDYVFEEDYRLPTLEEIKKHIEEKGHLPDMPSAKVVKANGIELGEMNKLLLEKIEQLTLYAIEQKIRMSEKESDIDELTQRLEKLENLLKHDK